MYVSDKRLYLTADGKVTEDPNEASGGKLLVGVGGELPNDEAERYGLIGGKAEKPPANKGRKGTANKAEAEAEAEPEPEAPAEE